MAQNSVRGVRDDPVQLALHEQKAMCLHLSFMLIFYLATVIVTCSKNAAGSAQAATIKSGVMNQFETVGT